jgi:formiminotetrahydrofolate cyclodeaminase
MFTNLSTSEFLAAVRRPDPTPGGGSASALTGALGASLLVMVAQLPKPRASGPAELERLAAAGSLCASAADTLEALVNRDSEAYEMVVGAYRLPKGTDDEKRVRSDRIQEAMRAAIEAPLDMMRACVDALAQAATVAALGNANAASDVRVAVELVAAGFRGAKANVEINLGSVKDPAYADQIRRELARLEQERASKSG